MAHHALAYGPEQSGAGAAFVPFPSPNSQKRDSACVVSNWDQGQRRCGALER